MELMLRKSSDAICWLVRLGVGALPICGDDNQLAGIITDCDIVLNWVAEGKDSTTATVEEFAGDEVVTIGADDSIDEALATMTKAGVRRLPVIDGHDLVGMLSQADIARNLPDDKAGDLVHAISSQPDND
jgi:CBS domain-containing protein